MKLAELRKQHPRFVYQAFAWQHDGETLTIEFSFLLEPNIIFTPRLKLFPLKKTMIEKTDRSLINTWVFNLGMIELFSYWKAAAPATIAIKAGWLNDQQLAWWKQLLLNGMGEFFYTNNLDFTGKDFVQFVCEADKPADSNYNWSANLAATNYLVPVGGGKDSALVLELLEENGLEYDVLLSHPQSPAAQKIAKLSRAKNILHLERTFDPQLLELNRTGYLNGHTPFSARLAFESLLAGLLAGHQQVLLANEFSANEGNVEFHGETINHQYSKSFEFEQRFREYVDQYLSPAPEYLSLLRPLHELQIAGLFANYPRYHFLFKSCNREQQQESWCGECPKCLFVFTALYPFLEENQLTKQIFSENIFAKEGLENTVKQMLGQDEHKPFECIGTYEETLAAFYLSIKRFKQLHPHQGLPPVLAFVQQEILSHEEDVAQYAEQLICSWNEQHHLTGQLTNIVRAAQQRLCAEFNEIDW
jgi:hypothetical protein